MRKREQRRKVRVSARMRIGQSWVDVLIRNMSSRGMLVETASPPPVGSYVEIRRATHIIVARAVWRRDKQFGVRTQDRLDVDAIVGASPVSAKAAMPDGRPERRSDPARVAARAAQSAERSRHIAATLQFLSIVALGLGAAGYAAFKVYSILSASANAIAERL